MMKADLVEVEGTVHAVNQANSEYTLCGDAFDLASDVDGYGWTKPTRRIVDCESGVTIIRSLRGLHTR